MKRFFTAAALCVGLAMSAQAQVAVSAWAQALVADWYARFLHRAVDAGVVGWETALDQGQDAGKILAGILGSDEYFIHCGGTPQGFVETLFTELNGRAPTPDEYNRWAVRLAQIGGPAPDFEHRGDFAYEMLATYPQNWQPAPPAAVPAPAVVPAPGVVVAPVISYGRRYGPHDDFEYRRPFIPAVRVEHDHRVEWEHARRDEHEHRR